jgi:SAM-dependent methyltransferase
MSGWDFRWLEGRAQEMKPPWNFPKLVRDAASGAARMLDIDTGGGEFLASLAPFAAQVVATEGYGPNVALAGRRLHPLRVAVVHAESAPDNVDQGEAVQDTPQASVPFRSAVFDLVVNRHSSYWPSEVHRVLSAGGHFLTQQRSEAGTHGSSWAQLFGRPPHPHARFTLSFAVRQLKEAGFLIARAEEADTPMVFFDLSGIVYYLRLVPWAVEDFDPFGEREALTSIHERFQADGKLVVCGSHLLIDARRR